MGSGETIRASGDGGGGGFFSGNVTTFVVTFVVILVIFNIIRNFFTNKPNRLFTLAGMQKLVDTLAIFCKLMVGDGEVILEKVVGQLKKYDTLPVNIRLGLVHFVYTDKPEDLQIILNNSASLGKGAHYRFFKMVVGEGLFTAPVPKWKKHRRLISPVFNARLLENFFNVFNEKNQLLVNKLKKVSDTDQVVDLWDYVAPTALEIICETAMGFDAKAVDEKEKEDFQELVVKVSEEDSLRIYKLWLHPDFIFKTYSKWTGHWKDLEDVRELPMKIIKYKKKMLTDKKQTPIEKTVEEDEGFKTIKKTTTFLDKLLELNEEGAGFSDQDLYDETITMMIGGSETSAITNSFTLLMLAMHPQIQDKVYKEVIDVLGEKEKFIEMKDVQNMTYLEQCIKETLRLFPTGPLLLREASETFTLSNNFKVHKGAAIIVPPIMVHRNPNVYENPLLWNPENFAPENVEKRNNYSFLGFSGGPRGCIGSRYALLSMKLTLSLLLKNYEVTTDVKMEDIRVKLDLLLRSVHGYKVKLRTRNPK